MIRLVGTGRAFANTDLGDERSIHARFAHGEDALDDASFAPVDLDAAGGEWIARVAEWLGAAHRLTVGSTRRGRAGGVAIAARSDRLCATALFDGATSGERFRAYVADTLAPVLKPDDTVILDNLQAHKVMGALEVIEAAEARLLYLPPYSSDFNPIKQIFAKLMALLRTVAARTVPDL